jgi:hypothetical protein
MVTEKAGDKYFFIKVIILISVILVGFANKSLNLNQYFTFDKPKHNNTELLD